MTRGPRVTIAAPTFDHPGPDDTPAKILRTIARNLRQGFPVGGSNVSEGLARVCVDVAVELETEDEFQRDVGGPANLLIETGDCTFAARCLGCGDYLIELRPDQSFDLIAQAWDEHSRSRRCAA